MSARTDARDRGALTYVGKRCPAGHNGVRYVSTGNCAACMKEYVARRVTDGYFRRHYSANNERICANTGRYYAAHRVEMANASRAWIRRNPEKRRAISTRYKAIRRSRERIGVTYAMQYAWVRDQPKVCFYCGADCAASFHVDHFMPLARGGAHVLTNLRIACRACNLRKSARDPLDWIDDIAGCVVPKVRASA